MSNPIKTVLAPLASLKLTVTLLALSLLLVYAGTWAQVDNGIWQVQSQYFHSFYTWVHFQTLFPRSWSIPGGFPMLGGYSLGMLLLINLVAAHALRFKLAWKRSGVILIHVALILLLVGEGIRSGAAVESQMMITEGGSANYSYDIREAELAIIDPSHPEHDEVVVIKASELEKEGVIEDARLPFRIRVDDYYRNSNLLGPFQAGGKANARATAGDGVRITAQEIPVFSGTSDAEKVDRPSAYITLSKGEQNLGTYLVSIAMENQEVVVDGKAYEIALRFRRYYKPYTIHLIEFRHDRYLGTDVPKNYSSQVRLLDPTRNEDREVLIWMNHPLRYAGETFFQASFVGETTTVLQVVNNPGWLMPYIACGLGALGLLIHFGMMLLNFIDRSAVVRPPVFDKSAARQGPKKGSKVVVANGDHYTLLPQRGWTSASFLLPAGLLLLCLAYLGNAARPKEPTSAFDIKGFGNLPISYEGRIQPLDSLARNSLRAISERETFLDGQKKRPAIEWLMDVMLSTEKAEAYKVFRIDSIDLRSSLHLDAGEKLHSFKDIVAQGTAFEQQMERSRAVPAQDRDPYQKAVLDLANRLMIYQRLGHQIGGLYLVPPLADGEEWEPLGKVIQASRRGTQERHAAAEHFLNLLQAYNENRPGDFNRELGEYHKLLKAHLPAEMTRVRFESQFNQFAPFLQSLVLYLLVFVLGFLSWLGWREPLSRAAFWVLLLALAVHTGGLLARIYISQRPPVTNLASSAIFIAWGAVILAAGAELFFRNGVSTVVAAFVGFISTLIYQRLSLDGDTMKVLQAVLDTNFWLATHVITITLGYAATFLAGAVGICYIIGGVFTTALTPERRRDLTRMTYGITCFAMFFSFVGTVLGGIWADQSWGRFWGWDPKENGAVMIVLANALLLHARWGGLVRDRGIACLAVFGNIVTAWSWFGTNMLGVGLHAYGFMDSALMWLLVFVLSQVALIGLANLPLRMWRSIGDELRPVKPPVRGGGTGGKAPA